MRANGVTGITLRAVEWALAIVAVALLVVGSRTGSGASEVAFVAGFLFATWVALCVADDEYITINREVARGALWALVGFVMLISLFRFF